MATTKNKVGEKKNDEYGAKGAVQRNGRWS
jgi:hypothetical protein